MRLRVRAVSSPGDIPPHGSTWEQRHSVKRPVPPSDSPTKAASNPEKIKHEQSHINGTAKVNMRQTDGMVREDKTDIDWTNGEEERNNSDRVVIWKETEDRNAGDKGRNRRTKKEVNTAEDDICRAESDESGGNDDDDDERAAELETEKSSMETEESGDSSDWTDRKKRCAADGLVFKVMMMPKKNCENTNVDTNICNTPADDDDDDYDNVKNISWTGVWGTRHTLGLLVFLGLTVSYMTRVGLSIAIVAMVGTRHHHQDGINDTQINLTDVCPPSPSPSPSPSSSLHIQQHTNHTQPLGEGDFNWDEKTQGLVLGAFFYGYMANCFLGGRAAEYLGGRVVYGIGVVLPSFLTLFTSLCVSVSKELFIVLRVLEGLGQALVYPALSSMLAAWVPPRERATFMAVVLSGSMLGTMLAMSVGGWLCSSGILGGWPFMFYLFGGLGVLWGVPWYIVAHDHPETHPRISKAELDYIIAHRTYVKRDKIMPLPIREIASSPSFWTLMVVSFGYHYTTFNLLTELPSYFNNIQHFQLSSNGLLSALPFLTQWLTSVSWAALISFFSSRNLISIAVVRKLSTAVGTYGSAIALVSMIWVNCNSTVAMTVLCVAVGCLGTINSGSLISEQDIAPNFAGSLKGLTNTVASATGFLAPAITGAIINDNQTLTAWRTVFLLAAALSVICTTQYLFLGTDKVQPWNYPKPKSLAENKIWLEDGVETNDNEEP
ncbi:hypothetical protein Pmani_005265 [Petrolisthes manimaculis]|uniref:Major facilitator superfamily (MFS) profile domain-containing protein n=1 Tax=Petrolisthes manimaculis TaxID=1843537 RepID=A0AAE1UMC9_9EUCA|nr:hypothetical protein Pmani_005265 [Petrolisthes manimaculis]